MKKTRNSKPKSTAKQMGNIRIIAGKYRGRKLPVVMADGLRPTTDRVKETVFNWLMPYLYGSNCLDCFAGSGSLGFEALSRGASQVTLIEKNKQAAQQLKANQQLLAAVNMKVVNQDALAFTQHINDKFHLVFIDPPFRQGLVKKTLDALSQGCLTEQAIVYVEMEAEQAAPELSSDWSLLKEKVAGQVAYRLYQYTTNLG